ncbi:unnamed protein product [Polarella glacialis]|uniref:Uncharacterized protein n=1 Tax=Polarella glacialis TaxID=89957 RepID=A0A813FN50_POLGL|nr:unnamed protein product [Polarella glacialis]
MSAEGENEESGEKAEEEGNRRKKSEWREMIKEQGKMQSWRLSTRALRQTTCLRINWRRRSLLQYRRRLCWASSHLCQVQREALRVLAVLSPRRAAAMGGGTSRVLPWLPMIVVVVVGIVVVVAAVVVVGPEAFRAIAQRCSAVVR